MFHGRLREPGFEAIIEHDLADGQHRNPDDVPGWFTTAYFHHPDELSTEAVDAGLEQVEVVVVEGPAWLLPDLDDRLTHDHEACYGPSAASNQRQPSSA